MRLRFIIGILFGIFLTSAIYPTFASATPNAVDDSFTVDLDSTDNNLDVLANDTGSGVLAISNVSFPVHGTLEIGGSLGLPGVTLSYTPAEDYFGPDSFGYTITEDGTLTSSGSVTIDVQLVCNGVVPTIIGSMGIDNIVGTNGADVIVGLGGDDVINGAGGKDIICGGSGNDNIQGKGGVDIIRGGSGNDAIHGNGGNDTIYGGPGNDDLKGGGKNDNLFGGDGDDTLNGNNGDDDLFGEAGNDRLKGANGSDDLCDGGSGSDTQFGGTTCETTVSIP